MKGLDKRKLLYAIVIFIITHAALLEVIHYTIPDRDIDGYNTSGKMIFSILVIFVSVMLWVQSFLISKEVRKSELPERTIDKLLSAQIFSWISALVVIVAFSYFLLVGSGGNMNSYKMLINLLIIIDYFICILTGKKFICTRGNKQE